MPYTVRDHLRHENRQITTFQRKAGTTIQWWEFDRADTTRDAVYDEGPGVAGGGRLWYPPKMIPVYSIIRVEGVEVPGPEGKYTVDTIHVSALLDQLRKAGLSNLLDAQSHLNDRFVWDSFVWEIRTYQIQGRLQTYETTVGIQATKVSPEEMINDSQFGAFDQP